MRLILAFALCISTSVMMTPAHGLQFVADQVTRSGGHVHRGSLYYRDAMLRIAHNDPGSIEVTIVRKDKGVMWLLLGRTKQFATLPFDGSTGVRLERSMAQEIRRETVGTEILDGHPTTLFQITVEEGKEEGRPASSICHAIIDRSNPHRDPTEPVKSDCIRAIYCITLHG
jgi:hypothetical protein